MHLLTITIAVILLGCSWAAEQKCEPGSTFMQDCNHCTCTDDGTAAYCTEKACLKPLVSVESGRRKRASAGDPCEPGTKFMADDGCNFCSCTSDGKAACTRLPCEVKKQD